jgi:hypothetical protein
LQGAPLEVLEIAEKQVMQKCKWKSEIMDSKNIWKYALDTSSLILGNSLASDSPFISCLMSSEK